MEIRPVPDTAERAVELAEAGALAPTEKITVRSIAGEKYDRIVGCRLVPMPEAVFCEASFDEEEVPFRIYRLNISESASRTRRAVLPRSVLIFLTSRRLSTVRS